MNDAQLAGEMDAELSASFPPRRPVLRAIGSVEQHSDAQDRLADEFKRDPIQARLEILKSDITKRERLICSITEGQSIHEAKLQGELARLHQEMAEKEAEIIRAIEENRTSRSEELSMHQRLIAADKASIAALQAPLADAGVDLRGLGASREVIVHKHKNINTKPSK
ncbi:hypothetical protein MesoLjLc_51750 [Mesorhizobium sp. L-8-10]|nr:hypothetical protein MesoLjLc_51750 [Mesorhizobium sp. L-8-10]